MRENKFKSDFDDENRNDNTNIRFNINMPDNIHDSGGENSDGNPGIIHGFSARSDKHGGFMDFALFFKIKC